MPSLDVGGVQLFCEEKGEGQPLVFVHGIPTDYRAWSVQVEEFSKDYRAVSYSRRYAWPNKREGDLSDSTIQNNASDLSALVEKMNVGPVNLVGHSYGGFTAAYMAATSPHLVRSLVLVEPAIATLLIEDETSSAQLLGLLFRSPSVALSARRFKGGSLIPALQALSSGRNEKAVELNVDGVQDRPGAFGKMPEPVREMMLDNARSVAELKTKLPPFREMAPRIGSRTLVVNGQMSAPWLRRIGELTAAAVRGSEHVQIPRARHFPHLENPQEFNGLLRTFLAEAGDAPGDSYTLK